MVISARAIPGNEKAIGRVMNHIARRGVDVVTESHKHVHVSGHGIEEELKLVLSLVRPRYFIPIHGEYRQLARHARVAELVTGGLASPVDVIAAEDGDVIRFDAEGARIADKAPAGRVLIDGTRVGEVGDEVLRDRRHIAADGLVVPVVAINRQTGVVEGMPELIARGFVTDNESEDILREGSRSKIRATTRSRIGGSTVLSAANIHVMARARAFGSSGNRPASRWARCETRSRPFRTRRDRLPRRWESGRRDESRGARAPSSRRNVTRRTS